MYDGVTRTAYLIAEHGMGYSDALKQVRLTRRMADSLSWCHPQVLGYVLVILAAPVLTLLISLSVKRCLHPVIMPYRPRPEAS
jgi:hypothetical protein